MQAQTFLHSFLSRAKQHGEPTVDTRKSGPHSAQGDGKAPEGLKQETSPTRAQGKHSCTPMTHQTPARNAHAAQAAATGAATSAGSKASTLLHATGLIPSTTKPGGRFSLASAPATCALQRSESALAGLGAARMSVVSACEEQENIAPQLTSVAPPMPRDAGLTVATQAIKPPDAASPCEALGGASGPSAPAAAAALERLPDPNAASDAEQTVTDVSSPAQARDEADTARSGASGAAAPPCAQSTGGSTRMSAKAPQQCDAANGAPEGDIERLRQERIAANQARLRALGLGAGMQAALAPAVPPSVKRGPTVPRKRVPPAEPTRRSSRRKGENPVAAPLPGEAAPAPIWHPGVPTLVATPSAVKARSGAASPWQEPLTAREQFRGYGRVHLRIRDVPFRGVYAMDWLDGLLGVAGKDGKAAFVRVPHDGQVPTAEDRSPGHACKLHRGWISDLQFLDTPAPAGFPWLLTASNDAEIAIWDTSRRDQRGAFQRVAFADDVHSSGVHAVHALQRGGTTALVSASKDGSVAVSAARPDGKITAVRTWEAPFGGRVAKSARWRGEHIIAAGGQERSLLILDDRAAEATCHIPKATGSVVNQVLWARGLQRTPREAAVTTRPTADAFGAADHLLLATSMDETIAVFDVRATAKPWARLRGHCGAVGPNKGAIYQADMTWGGRGVVTGGTGRDCLSVYDLRKCEALPAALRYGEADDDGDAGDENGGVALNVAAGAAGAAAPTTALLSQTDITKGGNGYRTARRTVRCNGALVACAGESTNVTVLRAAVGPPEQPTAMAPSVGTLLQLQLRDALRP